MSLRDIGWCHKQREALGVEPRRGNRIKRRSGNQVMETSPPLLPPHQAAQHDLPVGLSSIQINKPPFLFKSVWRRELSQGGGGNSSPPVRLQPPTFPHRTLPEPPTSPGLLPTIQPPTWPVSDHLLLPHCPHVSLPPQVYGTVFQRNFVLVLLLLFTVAVSVSH